MFDRVFRREHWYIAGNPYQWRTWLRGVLPWCLDRAFPKGRDCASRGSAHSWYNRDGENSACYHCEMIAAGRLWNLSGVGERRNR